MRTKAKMCKATVNVMSFETESIDRHPFQFTEEELRYRDNEERTKLNQNNLIGLTVMIEHKGKLKKGKIYSFLKAYKVWGIVLLEAEDDDPLLIYVTTSQMADQNKVKFKEKLVPIPASKQHASGKATQEVNLNVIRLIDEIHELKYDSATRDTQTIIDQVVYARAVKTAPISRHLPEPKTWRQAMNSTHAEKWREASEDEIMGLDDMKTWKIVRPMNGVIPIDSKWVFKVKYTPQGEIEKYKARLVVRGDSQQAGLDFGEVFSPVAHNTICRMLLSMATACDFEIDHHKF